MKYDLFHQSTTIEVMCQLDGTWDQDIANLEACKPLTCRAPPEKAPDFAYWQLQYKIFFDKEISPVTTQFKAHCPAEANFVNQISEFEAVCTKEG